MQLAQIEPDANGRTGTRLRVGRDARDEALPVRGKQELQFVPEVLDDVDPRLDGEVPVLARVRDVVDVLRADPEDDVLADRLGGLDRKSTRLNSSH